MVNSFWTSARIASARCPSVGIGLPGSLLRLREDHEEGKRLFVRSDVLAQADASLLCAVGPGFAGTVQETGSSGPAYPAVPARDEDDVFRLLAVGVFVDAIVEPGRRCRRPRAATVSNDRQGRRRHEWRSVMERASLMRLAGGGSTGIRVSETPARCHGSDCGESIAFVSGCPPCRQPRMPPSIEMTLV